MYIRGFLFSILLIISFQASPKVNCIKNFRFFFAEVPYTIANKTKLYKNTCPHFITRVFEFFKVIFSAFLTKRRDVTCSFSRSHQNLNKSLSCYNCEYIKKKSLLKSDSHVPKKFFICFNDSPSKLIKNAFYFILKALFVFKIFKFLTFWSCRKKER